MQVIHSCSQQQKLQPVARAMTSRRAFRPITHQAQGAWYLPMTDRYNEHRLNAWRQSDRTSTRSSIPVAPTHTETRQPHCSFHFVTSIFLVFFFYFARAYKCFHLHPQLSRRFIQPEWVCHFMRIFYCIFSPFHERATACELLHCCS